VIFDRREVPSDTYVLRAGHSLKLRCHILRFDGVDGMHADDLDHKEPLFDHNARAAARARGQTIACPIAMRMPNAVLTSVVVLILAPILLPLGAVLLIPAAMLIVPVIPVFALVGLATLLVLAARSRQPGTDSAPGSTQALIGTRRPLRQLSPVRN
jgi:hypothetical protein